MVIVYHYHKYLDTNAHHFLVALVLNQQTGTIRPIGECHELNLQKTVLLCTKIHAERCSHEQFTDASIKNMCNND